MIEINQRIGTDTWSCSERECKSTENCEYAHFVTLRTSALLEESSIVFVAVFFRRRFSFHDMPRCVKRGVSFGKLLQVVCLTQLDGIALRIALDRRQMGFNSMTKRKKAESHIGLMGGQIVKTNIPPSILGFRFRFPTSPTEQNKMMSP